MVNDKDGAAFALIQDIWKYWKEYGDRQMETKDWMEAMSEGKAIFDKYKDGECAEIAVHFVQNVFWWLEEKARAGAKEVPGC